ncbi:hypothetical protein IC620_05635 [Hazenella sp. IB182357]|uniref:DUF2178 domain-containing protein n=1 Tax=Polycladospora coralii TaxID=2771432 RepID=A0A926N5J1_9BACL|nr:hypothetical protein [Polycladospora coralii]MBD1371839.1 hypothetical protein [Polycladospora coralii]MBS7529300.1 hypothetical protein [Polycladospora coralii]
MKEKLTRFYWFNVLFVILVGWAFCELMKMAQTLAYVLQTPQVNHFSVEIGVIPFVLILIFAIVAQFRFKSDRKWFHLLALPIELIEDDEREKSLTAEACRQAYIVFVYFLPIHLASLVAGVFLKDWMPYYPVLLLVLNYIIYHTIYYRTLIKSI